MLCTCSGAVLAALCVDIYHVISAVFRAYVTRGF